MRNVCTVTPFAAMLLAAVWSCDNSYANGELEEGRDSGVETEDGPPSASFEDPIPADVIKHPVEDEATALFDATRIAEVRLTLPPEEWEKLLVNARDKNYIPADISIDGEELGEVGLRFKGSYGSLYTCFEDDVLVCPKLPMKVRFNKYDAEKRYKGLNRLNLHGKRDEYLLTEHISYKLFREMGIPTARTGYANVWVNDELLGVFGMVEQIDGRFTDSRFEEGDGNLYKEVLLTDDEEALTERLRTHEERADHRAFKAFQEAMIEAEDAELVETTSSWMNMTYLMRYMAVDDTIFNWDGITAFFCGEDWGCLNHNFYVYQEETTDRFWLIPWDLDATFVDSENWLGTPAWTDLTVDCNEWSYPETAGAAVRPACGDPFLRAMALNAAASDAYENAIIELRDEVFVLDAYLSEIDAIGELLEPAMEADPDRTSGSWSNTVRIVRSHVRLAHDTLLFRGP